MSTIPSPQALPGEPPGTAFVGEDAAGRVAEAFHTCDFPFADAALEAGPRLEAQRREAEEARRLRTSEKTTPAAAAVSLSVSTSDAVEPWEAFYQQHTEGRFFKARRYLPLEFPVLRELPTRKTTLHPDEVDRDRDPDPDPAVDGPLVVEIGCGNGSSIVGLMNQIEGLRGLAVDVSPSAVRLTLRAGAGARAGAGRSKEKVVDDNRSRHRQKSHRGRHRPRSTIDVEKNTETRSPTGTDKVCDHDHDEVENGTLEARPNGEMVWDGVRPGSDDDENPDDLPAPQLTGWVADMSFPGSPHTTALRVRYASSASAVLVIFIASALAGPTPTARLFATCAELLSPGAVLLFRDYGVYDVPMLRFHGSSKVDESLYRRGDGTLAYFFTTEVVQELLQGAGLEVLECEYHTVWSTNRKRGTRHRRVFVHAVARKRTHTAEEGDETPHGRR